MSKLFNAMFIKTVLSGSCGGLLSKAVFFKGAYFHIKLNFKQNREIGLGIEAVVAFENEDVLNPSLACLILTTLVPKYEMILRLLK